MKFATAIILFLFFTNPGIAQSPCGKEPKFRALDFWVGSWEAFGINGKKAGDSKISVILDSCVILEEWISEALSSNFRYSGKSFNTYNKSSGQWQQTWVDNTGSSTEYLEGITSPGIIIFKTKPFQINKDTIAVRRLTFSKLPEDKVRQHGEISKNNEKTWKTEYDLEYRRRKLN